MKRITPAQVRKLHAAGRERGIDSELLHEHIRMLTGKESIKQLTCGEAAGVIDSLEGRSCGTGGGASVRQMACITGLMAELGWVDGKGHPDMDRLDGMCRKYVKTDSYRRLDKRNASKIIEALKNMAAQGRIDISAGGGT